MHDFHFFGGWMMFFWWFLLILILYLVLRPFLNASKSANKEEEDPLEILKRRYAEGEISKEEFESRKKELL